MSELYHEQQIHALFCPICKTKVGEMDLHMRTYHPGKQIFYVSKRDIENQSTLADICPYCDSKTANIIAHVRECHPECYQTYLFGE